MCVHSHLGSISSGLNTLRLPHTPPHRQQQTHWLSLAQGSHPVSPPSPIAGTHSSSHTRHDAWETHAGEMSKCTGPKFNTCISQSYNLAINLCDINLSMDFRFGTLWIPFTHTICMLVFLHRPITLYVILYINLHSFNLYYIIAGIHDRKYNII